MGSNREHQESQAWAHWEYAPDEWALLDRMDWGRVSQRYWLTIGIGFLGLLLGLALFTWVVANAILGLVVMLVLFLLFLYFVPLHDDYRRAKKRHQARQDPSQPHRVTLSSQGIWGFGAYFPFTGTGLGTHEIQVKLLEVRLTSQPTTLHFRVEHLTLTASADRGIQEFPVPETIHMLVPRDHESEAEHVAQRFRTEVIEAREIALKRFRDAQTNPPEPS